MYEQIKYEVSDKVLTITLNRPDALNAYTKQMCDELCAAFDRADADDGVRAIIVTGAGRAFCAGADLSRGKGAFDHKQRDDYGSSLEDHRDIGGLLTLRIFELKKPIIAAINGPAVGIGITKTLPMDLRLASSSAKIGFVFTRRGIVPEACSSWFLPRLVGVSQAAEWFYSGRVFAAEEALAGRLVSRVVPPEELLPLARKLAGEIAQNTSAVCVALSRQLIWRMLGADHPMEAHKQESRLIYWSGSQADAQEGVASFLEKRPADFTMKISSDMPSFYPWWPDRPFKDPGA